jgi:magnesium-transporting ATPase (P-type)
MAINKKINLISSLMFIFVLIHLLAYFISGESSVYFQDLLASKHLNDKIFDEQNQWALMFMGIILILNMQSLMQSVQYQKVLLLILCTINLFLPINIHFYALLSAVNNTILVLTNAWIQLFCPATLRGMVAGILTGIYGVLDIFDTSIENFRIFDEKAMHSCANLMFILMLVMFWRLKKSSHDLAQQFKPQEDIQIHKLFQRYLFIFLSCILVGLNSGIFYYTFNDALMIFPSKNPNVFQYMVNIVSVVSPFIFGFIADKYGYMRTQM